MKNIITGFFVVFCVNSSAQNNQTVQFTFGRYGGQGNECTSGRGVCSFSISTSDKLSEGIILKKRSENSLILQLNKIDVSTENQISITGKPFKDVAENEMLFLQSNDLYLNEQTLQLLGINTKFNKFPKGEYPIKNTREGLEIIIELKTSD